MTTKKRKISNNKQNKNITKTSTTNMKQEKDLKEINDTVAKIAKENQTPDLFYANLWEEIFLEQ